MVTTSAADAWAKVQDSRDRTDGWHLRRLGEVRSCGCFIGILWPAGRPGLIIEVSRSAISKGVEYPESVGFSLQPATPKVGGGTRVQLVLELRSADYESVFLTLADDIVGALHRAPDEVGAVSAFLERLSIWQAFMRKHSAAGLGRIEVVGLFGELIFLRELLRGGFPAKLALAAWRGPYDGIRDFVFGEAEIEIKATSFVPPSELAISNVAQLDESTCNEVYVAHVCLVESKTSGESLTQLVDSVREEITNGVGGARALFDDLLIVSGYVDQNSGHQTTCYQTESISCFKVQDEFPRITPADIRAGVSECKYKIQIAAMDPFRVETGSVLSKLHEHVT